MNRFDDNDIDATSWAGESDPSLVEGTPPTAPVAAPGKPPSGEQKNAGIPSFLLVAYGVLGGAYLLYTVGWLLTLQRFGAVRVSSNDVLVESMTQLGFVFAMASPALWFLAVWVVTRGRKPVVRLLWIIVGLVVVLPWPFVWGVWS
jgi:hypothetical protein